MIISSKKEPLSDMIHDFKKIARKRIIEEQELINESRKEWLFRVFERAGVDLKRISKHKVWQDGNHPIQLESNKFIDEKRDCIHNNPVDAEVVDEAIVYSYSLARNYSEQKGLIDVKLFQ